MACEPLYYIENAIYLSHSESRKKLSKKKGKIETVLGKC